MANDVDLSALSLIQMRERLGELVEISLRKSRVAVVVSREDGTLTLLDPRIVAHAPAEELITMMVEAEWPDSQIEEFMQYLEGKP